MSDLIETIASELALIDDYNPNAVPPERWAAIAQQYRDQATRIWKVVTMADQIQIPEQTMKMLTDEAWEHFCANAQFTVGASLGVVRETFEKSVRHTIERALEEGIVQMPILRATDVAISEDERRTLREIRRATVPGRLHDDLAQQLSDPEHIASPTTWVVLAHEVATNGTTEAARELAQKVLDGVR